MSKKITLAEYLNGREQICLTLSMKDSNVAIILPVGSKTAAYYLENRNLSQLRGIDQGDYWEWDGEGSSQESHVSAEQRPELWQLLIQGINPEERATRESEMF